MMIVPQYPYPIVGGLERQAHELSKSLLRQGLQITVLSGKINGMGPETEMIEGVQVIRLPWSSMKCLRVLRTFFALALNMFKIRSKYDVVHLHNISWIGTLVILLAKKLGKPVIAKLPNFGDFGIPGMKKRFLGQLLLHVYKKADAIIAMTPESIRELRDIDYPESRIFKITNGVSSKIYYPLDEIKEGINHPTNIVFTGRLSHEKGIIDLISVWPQIVQESSGSVVLNIYGDGPQRSEIMEKIQLLDIANKVILHGHIENISSELRNADIFVLPSYAEGNSNAILEAMASGLPIVSTRVGGTSRLMGKTGSDFLTSPGDQEGLKHCLLRLISDAEKRNTLGKLMRSRVQSFFRIEKIADRYNLAYCHLIHPEKGKTISSLSSSIFEGNI